LIQHNLAPRATTHDRGRKVRSILMMDILMAALALAFFAAAIGYTYACERL
jgi:hypothetical protein